MPLCVSLKATCVAVNMSYFHAVCYSGADATACDNSDLNPFMLALGKGHKAVAEFMLEKGANCLGPGGEAIEWALENNITLFFQVQ